MSYAKRRLRLTGGLLGLVALGVMALASTAWAGTAEYVVSGSKPLAVGLKVTGTQVGPGLLLVPGALDLQVKCAKFTVQEGVIESGTKAKTKLLYEECKTFNISKGEELECHPVVNNALTGGDYKLNIQATGTLLPVHIGGGEYAILAEDISALILYLKDTGCTLPLHVVVTGEFCARIDGNHSEKPLILLSEAIQSECPERTTLKGAQGAGVKDVLKYGTNTAHIFASAHVFITGTDEGKALGISLELTNLCKAKEGSCEAYPLKTKISASLEEEVKFVFPFEGEELEPPCRVSTMSGITTTEGEVLIGELTELSFKECGGGLCTVSPQNLPYKFEIKATSEGNGTMTWASGGSGSPAFAINCLGLAKCIYGATSMSLTIAGGNPAKLSGGGVALKREAGSSEACGESGAKWEGIVAAEGKIKYKITTPSPLFVRLI